MLFCSVLFYFPIFFLLICFCFYVLLLFSDGIVYFVLFCPCLQTIRSALNDNVNPADFSNPTAVRLGSALVPGIMMTPVSSLLGKSSPLRVPLCPNYKERSRIDTNKPTIHVLPDTLVCFSVWLQYVRRTGISRMKNR